MKSCLLHIYGPICIQSWGLSIAIAMLVFIYFVQRDRRFAKLQLQDRWHQILSFGMVSGLVGARLLYIVSYDGISKIGDFFIGWQGGFSILGGILALILTVPLYVYMLKVPILPFADLITLYSPLLQSIARIGCFLAGCCYGLGTNVPWAITYTDLESFAPLNCSLHPAQIYSSLVLLLVFLALYFIIEPRCKRPGEVTCFYLMGVSFERFIVDFWRGDRVFSYINSVFSINQLVAIGIFIGAIIALSLIKIISNRSYDSIATT